MQSDKKLIARCEERNYEGENEFDNIRIYLPLTYDNDDMLSYIIQLNVINKDNVGDVITLDNPTIYKNRYKYEFPIPLKWASVPGKILLWLKFLKDDEIVGLTNEVCAMIFETKEIEDYIPEQSLSLLDEWTLKMEDSAKDMNNFAQHPPVVGSNGNWFIYNTKANTYIDSGVKVNLGVDIFIEGDYWIMFNKNEGDGY